MKFIPHVPGCLQGRTFVLVGLALGLFLLLAVLLPQGALADGGGTWPTPTPSPLPPPTWTPIFVTLPAVIAPTLTPEVVTLPAVIEPAVTPRPPLGGASLLCWPFALLFILIVIIGSIVLIGRRA